MGDVKPFGLAPAAGLFEPTEGRGPEAPPGVPFVGGVDLSAVRVSFAVESESGATRAVFTKSFTRPARNDVGERLDIIYAETCEFAQAIQIRYPLDQVAVEMPAMVPGKGGSEPILEYAAGVVIAAISAALRVPVWLMPVARWKKHAVGHGHAKKPEVLRWANDEFGARIEDEADASGVCRAARLIVWEGLADAKDLKRGAVPRSGGSAGGAR